MWITHSYLPFWIKAYILQFLLLSCLLDSVCHVLWQPLKTHPSGHLEQCHFQQWKCWMDNVKECTFLPMQKVRTTAYCRKDWKRISAESSIMFPPTTKSVKGLNWTGLNWTLSVSCSSQIYVVPSPSPPLPPPFFDFVQFMIFYYKHSYCETCSHYSNFT